MRSHICQSLEWIWSRWSIGAKPVPISACVHFGAFRYGCGDYQPYESYLVDLLREGESTGARARLAAFLQHYRPQHFGEAIGATLEVPMPLWFYPWDAGQPGPAWVQRAADCPDILTHFLPVGIPRDRLNEEFAWLERALFSIRTHGYQPGRFRSGILARKLVRRDGAAAYLLLDGNHRVAALSALGHREVPVSCPPWLTVREDELPHWRQVRAGAYSVTDAQRVFNAYFEGNRHTRTSTATVPLLEVTP